MQHGQLKGSSDGCEVNSPRVSCYAQGPALTTYFHLQGRSAPPGASIMRTRADSEISLNHQVATRNVGDLVPTRRSPAGSEPNSGELLI